MTRPSDAFSPIGSKRDGPSSRSRPEVGRSLLGGRVFILVSSTAPSDFIASSPRERNPAQLPYVNSPTSPKSRLDPRRYRHRAGRRHHPPRPCDLKYQSGHVDVERAAAALDELDPRGEAEHLSSREARRARSAKRRQGDSSTTTLANIHVTCDATLPGKDPADKDAQDGRHERRIA